MILPAKGAGNDERMIDMGDRYVVGFRNKRTDPTIWLYSHWGGSSRHNDIAEAIQAAHGRWGDPSYATRIAISSIVADDWEKETGFGISVGEFAMPDYSDVAIVNWESREVDIVDDNDVSNVRATLSFSDYVGAVISGTLVVVSP